MSVKKALGEHAIRWPWICVYHVVITSCKNLWLKMYRRNDTTCNHFGARTVTAISERGASEKLCLKRRNCSMFINQANPWIFDKHLQINYKDEIPQFHRPNIHGTILWGTWGSSQYKDRLTTVLSLSGKFPYQERLSLYWDGALQFRNITGVNTWFSNEYKEDKKWFSTDTPVHLERMVVYVAWTLPTWR